MKKEKNVVVLFVFFLLMLILISYSSIAIQPSGANVSVLNVSSAPLDVATSVNAQAGNVSELNVFGFSTTQTWQGYFGNVSGTLQLADANDYVLYNWSLASPQGEIYASTNSSISWLNTQCFNFTAAGTYASDNAQAGATSLYGTNLTQLETEFNINASDVDGVDETFTLSGAGTHDEFFTASRQFSEGECISTRVFDNTAQGVSNKFEEVLLYEPSSASVIFASLLEQDALAFNNRAHDFEMLVLEDGHEADTLATPYYFFVELQ